MITKSDSIATFAPAFAAAQAMVENAQKDAENPAFKRDGKAMKYADLTSVWDACRKAVTANDIGVIQSPGLTIDGKMHMETMLLHKSGEFICGELSIPLAKSDAQGYGSAVTYARRYALGAMMGICPEDDDGKAASEPAARHTRDELPPQSERSAGASPKAQAWARKQIEDFNGYTIRDIEAFEAHIKHPEYKDLLGKLHGQDKRLWKQVETAQNAAHARVYDEPF